jgi:selenocysteine lyase/cysteine desulfurase
MELEGELEKIRSNFPHLGDIIYLGAAGSSPFNLVVYNAIIECWNRRLYGSTLGGVSHAWFSEKEELCRNEAGRLIYADPEEICFISRVV